MKITFVVNGEEIDPERFDSGLGGRILRRMKGEIESKLAGLIDPKTGKPPEIIVTGKSMGELTIGTTGPPALVAEVKKRLGI